MNKEPMTCSEMLRYVDEVMSGHGTDDMLAVVERARKLAIQMEQMILQQAGVPEGRPKVWEVPKAPAHGKLSQ